MLFNVPVVFKTSLPVLPMSIPCALLKLAALAVRLLPTKMPLSLLIAPVAFNTSDPGDWNMPPVWMMLPAVADSVAALLTVVRLFAKFTVVPVMLRLLPAMFCPVASIRLEAASVREPLTSLGVHAATSTLRRMLPVTLLPLPRHVSTVDR